MDLTDHETKIVTLIDGVNDIEDSREFWRLDHTLAEILDAMGCQKTIAGKIL